MLAGPRCSQAASQGGGVQEKQTDGGSKRWAEPARGCERMTRQEKAREEKSPTA